MRDTREYRARELLHRLETGPAYLEMTFQHGRGKPSEIAKEHYRMWVHSWILAEVRDLIPELRRIAKAVARS